MHQRLPALARFGPSSVRHSRPVDGDQQALDGAAARHAAAEQPRRKHARVVDDEQIAGCRSAWQIARHSGMNRSGPSSRAGTAGARRSRRRRAPARSAPAADRNRSRERACASEVLRRDRSGRARRGAASTDRRVFATRSGRSSIVKSSMRTPVSTSFHVTGVETRRFRPRPHGIDRRQRPAPGVLVVVDQHAPARPLGDAVLGRDQRRDAAPPAPARAPWRTSRRPSAPALARSARRRAGPSSRSSSRATASSARRAPRARRARSRAPGRTSRRTRDRDRNARSRDDRRRRIARTTDSDRCTRD